MRLAQNRTTGLNPKLSLKYRYIKEEVGPGERLLCQRVAVGPELLLLIRYSLFDSVETQ